MPRDKQRKTSHSSTKPLLYIYNKHITMKYSKNKIVKFAFVLVLVSLMFGHGDSDAAKDKQECTESLIGLATCLPYVGGNAKAPTPDCCNGLKGVLKTNKKCLCVVIEDRNDPDLDLTINVTLALGLPAVCNAPANVSQCPALLHLDPNSPDAQIFYQNGHQTSNIAGSPASSPSAAVALNPISSPSGANFLGPSGQQKSDGGHNGKRSFGVEAMVTVLLLWSLN